MRLAPEQRQIDPRQVLASLGYCDVGEPVPVTGGWETLLWRFDTPDGRAHALRLYHLHDAATTARRECVALGACAAADLSAPRVERIGEYEGMPVVVQTWCPGAPLLTLLEKKPWAVGRLGRLFGRTQARLDMTPAPPEFAKTAPADWLSRVPREYAHLAGRADVSTGTLVHLDYHPLNVIVDRSGDASVIDWAYAAAGDARADLAVTATILTAAPIPPGPLNPLLNLMRALMARAWRAGYREIAGAMPDYRPFLAWSGAMILLGTEDAIGRPNVWGTEKDVEALRRLIDARARADAG
jgi:aminoglycoside phosphotransferase (APT) family kinase protein